MARPATLYVHFPWCLQKCPYCDFVSYAVPTGASVDHAGYADAVIAEATARRAALDRQRTPRSFHSIFFGGGTPSLWAPEELGRVLAALRALYPCTSDLEVTVECNPSSLDETRARALVAAGVTRLSIGTQSLRRDALSFLGRLHDGDGAIAAIRGALATGARVSTDLIFGLPDQASNDAVEQALALEALGLSHLSCYQLTIEPGTRFGELAKRGRLPRIDDGHVADAFVAIDDALLTRGLRHYEISNYARPGQESRHNLGYWRGWEYVGLGTGAYGFLRDEEPGSAASGVRYRNEVLPERYLERARRELPTLTEEPLDTLALLRERIMLGLRLAEGLDLAAHGHELGVDPFSDERERAIERLVSQGRMIRERTRLRLDKRAWLFCDDAAARLF